MSDYDCQFPVCLQGEDELLAEIECLRAEIKQLRKENSEMLGRLLQECRLRGEAEGELMWLRVTNTARKAGDTCDTADSSAYQAGR